MVMLTDADEHVLDLTRTLNPWAPAEKTVLLLPTSKPKVIGNFRLVKMPAATLHVVEESDSHAECSEVVPELNDAEWDVLLNDEPWTVMLKDPV